MKTDKKNHIKSSTQKKQVTPFFEKKGKNSFFQVQPKLKIGSANDQFEREAENISEQVVNKKSTNHRSTTSISKPKIQPKSSTNKGISVPTNFQNKLQKTESQGQQLPTDSLKSMNKSFGRDFSNVKIHTGQASNNLNQDIQAKAFTHKNNIYFNEGNFKPHTKSGKKLLAHELTHVVQQQFSPPQIQRDPKAEAKKKAEEEIAKEKQTIISTFKMIGITDDSEKWTLKDLKCLNAALSMLPSEDKLVLSEIEFIRVDQLSGDTIGQFESEQGIATGSTTPNIKNTIKLENGAFNKTPAESHQTIVHEVGHAIASWEFRKTSKAKLESMGEKNKSVLAAEAIAKKRDPLLKDFNDTVDALNAKIREFNKVRKGKDKTLIANLKTEIAQLRKDAENKKAIWMVEENALTAQNKNTTKITTKIGQLETAHEKTKISAKSIKTVKAKIPKTKKAYQAGMKTAKAAMKKKVAALKAAEKKSKPTKVEDDTVVKTAAEIESESLTFINSISAVDSHIENLAVETVNQDKTEDEVETLIKVVDKEIEKRDAEFKNLTSKNKSNPALTIFNKAKKAQDKWFSAVKAHSLSHQRTARVQKFVIFIDSNNIDPITPYAKDNWPHKPEEFYAEAYSWFFTKPNDLKKKSADLHKWFTNGNHKK